MSTFFYPGGFARQRIEGHSGPAHTRESNNRMKIPDLFASTVLFCGLRISDRDFMLLKTKARQFLLQQTNERTLLLADFASRAKRQFS